MNQVDKLILIGRVAGAHGVRGEVRITAYGDDPMALVGYRDLRRETGAPALTVLSGRVQKDALIARTAELADKDAADALRGLQLYVPRAILPEPDEDEFYLADLIGLQARDPQGEAIGRIETVQDFGAGDILEVKPPHGSSWMVAFTLDAVPTLNLAEGWLTIVRPQEVEAGAEQHAEHNPETPQQA